MPDLTVLLDVDPRQGLERSTGPGDRLEAESLEFHRRVRESFREIARHRRSAYVLVDATATPDAVHDQVLDAVAQKLPDLPTTQTLSMPLAPVRR
jgi:dTMP kinase